MQNNICLAIQYLLGNGLKQAGAELGQAQVKLEVVDEGLATV